MFRSLEIFYGINEHTRNYSEATDIRYSQSRWAELDESVKTSKSVEANSFTRDLARVAKRVACVRAERHSIRLNIMGP